MDVSRLTLEIFTELEQKWLMEWENSNSCSPDDTKKKVKLKRSKTRILSIDGGGGIKGLVAGEALIHLEDSIRSLTSDAGARIPDYFDLIAGTGVGGVLAVMITASDGSGRPLFSAKEAVEFLRSRMHRLFRPAGSGLLRQLRRRRRFSGSSFEAVLREALRSRTMRDTCRPLLVPCYDLNTSAPFVFSRADASESPSFDFDLWRVCRATSATPGLFKPFKIVSIDRTTACTAVDGGLVMNNPSAAAVTHVLHNKRDFPSVAGVEDLILLSLGNCPPSRRPETAKAAVMEIMLDGVSETVDQVLCNAFCWNRMDYLRIQGNSWVTEKEEEDGVEGILRAGERTLKERGVESLPFGGKRLLTETNGERIRGLVERLVAVAGPAGDIPPSPTQLTDTPVTQTAKGR